MIDVCSCSIDVWEGIKSYVQAIVKKIHRDIGIGDETVHVSIIQVTFILYPWMDMNRYSFSTLVPQKQSLVLVMFVERQIIAI